MRKLGAGLTGLLTLFALFVPLNTPAGASRFPSASVGMALTPDGRGWWVAGADGSVATGGSATSYGSVASLALSQPIVGIAATPSGRGYWLAASDGGIFSFGDAAFFGSTGSIKLNKPIVSVATTHSGHGYWLVASDGGLFSFGDAAFFGSTGSIKLNKPIVGGAATRSDAGYWLAASDGGIFSFGDATFAGSAAGTLAAPVVGIASSGAGYAVAAVNGVVSAFGDAAAGLGVVPGQSQNPSAGLPAAPTPPLPGTNPGVVSSATPSGVAMPAGNPPGWQMVFADDFAGASLNTKSWGPYEGQPGGDPGGWWDPSHVVVHDGMVELQNYQDPILGNRWVSGGLSSARALKQTFGKYLVRFRMDKGNGIAGIALLWPSNGGWPPEIDFAEDGGGNRSNTSATLHYGSANDQVQRSVAADFSQWHTIGVEWTPGHLVYTLDGAVWATVANANVPAVPMELDLQTQAGTCGDDWNPCADATTPAHVSMQVDWVVAYKIG
jgi:hypothetical protein